MFGAELLLELDALLDLDELLLEGELDELLLGREELLLAEGAEPAQCVHGAGWQQQGWAHCRGYGG